MAYYLITVSPDGIYFEEVQPEEFLAGLVEDGASKVPFLDQPPGDMNIEEWPESRMLIEGRIVKPWPVEIIKRYTLK